MFWAGTVALALVSLYCIIHGLREIFRPSIYGVGYFGTGVFGAWIVWVVTHETLYDEDDQTHFEEDDDTDDGN